MRLWQRTLWLVAIIAVAGGANAPAAPPNVVDLQTQQVGDITFFRVRIQSPSDMQLPQRIDWWSGNARDVSRLPKLVPQDDRTKAVYLAASQLENLGIGNRPEGPRDDRGPAPVFNGLEFYGKTLGGQAKFLLLYPTQTTVKLPILGGLTPSRTTPTWAEVALELDFKTAKDLPEPPQSAQRRNPPDRPKKNPRDRTVPAAEPSPVPGVGGEGTPDIPGRLGDNGRPVESPLRMSPDDLEGEWATSQAAGFAALAALGDDPGFYSFAREATNKKYHVSVAPLPRPWWDNRAPFSTIGGITAGGQDLYEMTTGATAVAESLQLNRLLGRSQADDSPRTIEVKTLRGIEIAEHPWKEMIGDKRPAAEPLAALVPHDNYYVSFHSIPKLAAFRQLVEAWGGNLLHSMSISNRDYALVSRYERQLCLSMEGLAKSESAKSVTGIAITGSDGYLVEGSDVAVLIQTTNAKAFLTAADPILASARKELGTRLKESRQEHAGVAIEEFTSPRREVSLYRATVDDVLVYANSPAGVRRVIDTAQGKRPSLADSLDFQYIRTVFRADHDGEDGFAFLSDPFVRQLVGPASRIKRKRRTEALASLMLATNSALFTAWETGSLPQTEKLLLASVDLQPGMLYAPGGKTIGWEPKEGRAVSDVYGTLAFATPLIELPIEKVTEQESRDYEVFRLQYLNLWRQFFDPIGMRVSLNDSQVKMEAYILPLIENSAYNQLRRSTGSGTTTVGPSTFAPETIFHVRHHINLEEMARNEMFAGQAMNILIPTFNFIGDRFDFRVDDSAALEKLGRIWLNEQIEPGGRLPPPQTIARTAWQVPLTVGVSIKNPVTLAALLASARTALESVLPRSVDWEPLPEPYSALVRIRPRPNPEVNRLFGNAANSQTQVLPTIYYGHLDGVLYVTLNENSLKKLADASKASEAADPDAVEVNSSLFLAPGAAKECGPLLRAVLEYQMHRQTLSILPTRYALYRCGLLKDAAPTAVQHGQLTRLLGYEPASPDGSSFEYLAKTDEVASARHGTLRRPKLQKETDLNSPASQLLSRLHSLRADLRFREDGVQTTLTIQFAKP